LPERVHEQGLGKVRGGGEPVHVKLPGGVAPGGEKQAS